MTSDEEIKKIVQETLELQKAERKKKADKENMSIVILIAGLIVGVTIMLAYIQTTEDKNNTDVSHTAFTYMSCTELKSLMQDVNKQHANDNLYSYAITDIHNEISGKC